MDRSLIRLREQLVEKEAQAEQSLVKELVVKLTEVELSADALARVLGAVVKGVNGEEAAPFKDPVHNRTWCGRGRLPLWLKRHEQAGGKREDFRVKKLTFGVTK